MKRKWMAVFGMAVVALVIGTTVFASGQIKLIVNGRAIDSDQTAPRIIDGHTMVSIRTAAEALGANVSWDNISKSVTIVTPAGGEDQKQEIQLLQQALAPTSEEDAIKKWAEYVKTRNGAAQYALLSSTLKEKTLQTYKEMNWVTGISSPWVDSYQISAPTKGANDSTIYSVTFQLKTSTGDAGGGKVKVTVNSKTDEFLISTLQITSGADDLSGIVVVP